MTPEERVAAKTIARIMRAARKQLGLTQTEVAPRLGISQSALCKFEKGQLIPSVYQWFEFCRLTGIAPDSHLHGYIDRMKPATLTSQRKEGSFSLPDRYAKNRGCSTRGLRPLLAFAQKELGEAKLDEFLASVKVDPDYFIHLDNTIAIDFSLDLMRYLTDQGVIKQKNLSPLVRLANQPEVHGQLRRTYDNEGSQLELLRKFVEHSSYYGVDFELLLEQQSANELVVAVNPRDHVAASKLCADEEHSEIFCRYFERYFERFSTYGGHPPLIVKEFECRHKGGSCCRYRLQTATEAVACS